ncbi:MAG: hypothetical protein L0H25_06800 [Micrococcales bacterium]|nr:hypothetical protein [Micrococcales bacterium]
MHTVMLTQAGTQGGFSWSGLVIVLIAFAVFYPLQARLRTTLSERRRRRWAEQEGTGPSSSDRSEDHEE